MTKPTKRTRQTKPTKRVAASRASAFALVALVLAAGCTSSGQSRAEVPTATLVSVVQNYFPADAASRAPDFEQSKYDVTDQQTIKQLTALFNALPTSPSQGITPCPSSLAPAYDLVFRDSAGGSPLAEVSVQCFGVMVTVQGHDEPIRSDSASPGAGAFLEKVAKLLAPVARSAT